MFEPESDSSFVAGNDKTPRNYIKFYRQWVRNNFKSKEEGREVGEDCDFILIISPGQSKTEVRRKASDSDKMQYSQEWSAYQQGKEMQMSGTPIEVLPGLASGMADALKALYIYTIEQMASLPDIAMQKIGMGGNEMRKKAQAYLAGSSQETIKLREELASANETIASLTERINALEAAPKRGRKPKLQVVA